MVYQVHIIYEVDWGREQVTTHCGEIMTRQAQRKTEDIVDDTKTICEMCMMGLHGEINSWEKMESWSKSNED